MATNNHVIAPTSGNRGTGTPYQVQAIEVVFQSGTGREWRAVAQVVANDPDRDLACLRFVVPKGQELPEPVALPGVKATETMPVYVCGFPFGEMLAEGDKNPEISIGPASVSSVRTDDRGEVQKVQLNGALNPGNSGGPVVAADGKLVGVAVTTIKGAGIGNAVPQLMVKQMMDGRVSEPRLIRGGPTGVTAVGVLVDPLGKVTGGKVWVAPLPDDRKTVADVSKLPRAASAAFSRSGIGGQVQAGLPPAGNLAEAWVQTHWTDANGSPQKGVAIKMEVENSAGGGMAGLGGPDGGFRGQPPRPSEGSPGGPFAGPGAPGGPFGGPFGDAQPRGPGVGPRPFGGGAPPQAEGMDPRRGMQRPAPGASPEPFGGGRPGKPSPQTPPASTAKPPTEEEEEAPDRPVTTPQQPAMTAPPADAPNRPAAGAADEDGVDTNVVFIAGGLMLVAVLGVAGVGVAAMYSGKPAKKTKKRRPARDEDEDEDDEDDRPRRRR